MQRPRSGLLSGRASHICHERRRRYPLCGRTGGDTRLAQRITIALKSDPRDEFLHANSDHSLLASIHGLFRVARSTGFRSGTFLKEVRRGGLPLLCLTRKNESRACHHSCLHLQLHSNVFMPISLLKSASLPTASGNITLSLFTLLPAADLHRLHLIRL